MKLPRPQPTKRLAAQVTAAVVGVGALSVGLATQATSDGPVLYPDVERHAPSALPDRVILTPTATPATSQSVSWRTSSEVSTAQAQIAPMAPGPAFEATATTINAPAVDAIQADLGFPVKFHTVTFGELTPDTEYLYRVGDGVNWSAWYEFETASDQADPFSFIYYGDAQNYVHEHVSRVFRRAFSDRPQADLIVHAGDLVDVANRDNEWGEWFDAAGWINGGVNSIAVPGNHEYQSGALAKYWDKQFEFPKNGPTALDAAHPETAYFTDYQGVRFVALNSNPSGDAAAMQAQADFLDAALEENPGKWSVVTFHHPVYAMTSTRNNQAVRDLWNPIFEKHGVDLVLQGHDHTYGRGNMKNASSGVSGVHNGTVYVVSVSGQKMYELNAGNNWTDNGAELEKASEFNQLYQLIDVDGDKIRYEARTADGKFHDGVTITKKADGTKTVRTVDESGTPLVPEPTDPPTTDPTPQPTPDPTLPAPAVKAPGRVGTVKVAGSRAAARRTVRWSAPRATGGAPIRAYRIVIKRGNKVLVNRTIRGNQRSLAVASRKLGTGRHVVTVTAQNTAGWSPATRLAFQVRQR